MARQVMEGLVPRRDGVYVDGTLGGGGHTRLILEAGGRVFGMDRDWAALERVAETLSEWSERLVLVHGNFADMSDLIRQHGVDEVDGVLLDLGVSSNQIDEADRGFSFQQDGPLDMRMDSKQKNSAADWVNTLSREELANLFREYGEEKRAWQIAGAMVRERQKKPFSRTVELADVVASASGGRRGRIHPATRVFQALRIAVNDELGSLEQGLTGGLDLLKTGGRMAVISFHSLEDRRVKQFFNKHAGKMEALQQGGEQWVGEQPAVKKITRKAATASREEVRENPRSRSAKLRIAERINYGA